MAAAPQPFPLRAARPRCDDLPPPPRRAGGAAALPLLPMNAFDLVVVVLIALAAIGGYRVGLVARVASWSGLVIGLILATLTVPTLLEFVEAGTPLTRLFVGVGGFVLITGLVASLAELLGLRLRGLIHRGAIRPVDQAGGAVAGGVGILVLVWLLLPVAAEVPGGISRQVRTSSLAKAITAVAPAPPDPMRVLQSLVSGTRFPDVFEDLRPAPDTGAPPSQLPLSAETLQRVEAATVNVESVACQRRFEGSGWVVGPGSVVTNAHVVAGSSELEVRRPNGEVLAAQVVVFDDDRDLALLDVPGLDAPTLEVTSAVPGTQGAVVGYPGGQDVPRPTPATVSDRRTTVGRDIYGRDRVSRQVLFLAAELRHGDSGAPVVDAQGRVVGVVFAISPDRPTTAYALADDEVSAVLDNPRQPGVAGSCM